MTRSHVVIAAALFTFCTGCAEVSPWGIGRVPTLASASASGTLDGWSTGQHRYLLPLVAPIKPDFWPEAHITLASRRWDWPKLAWPPADLQSAAVAASDSSVVSVPIAISLSDEQLIALSEWLDAHRWGWGPLLYTPPPGSTFWLALAHVDGSFERIEFYSHPDSGAGAILWDSKGGHVQGFSREEIGKLRLLLQGVGQTG